MNCCVTIHKVWSDMDPQSPDIRLNGQWTGPKWLVSGSAHGLARPARTLQASPTRNSVSGRSASEHQHPARLSSEQGRLGTIQLASVLRTESSRPCPQNRAVQDETGLVVSSVARTESSRGGSGSPPLQVPHYAVVFSRRYGESNVDRDIIAYMNT